jgi:hypothetical protein
VAGRKGSKMSRNFSVFSAVFALAFFHSAGLTLAAGEALPTTIDLDKCPHLNQAPLPIETTALLNSIVSKAEGEYRPALVSCSIDEVADEINQGKQVIVPKLIYHFGKEKILREDIEARTVPKEAWDKFIMGDSVNFKANPPFRKGFYGTAGIDTNFFGKFDSDWLIEIQIKDKCLDPEEVVSLRELAKSPRFTSWFNSIPESKRRLKGLAEFDGKCSAFAGAKDGSADPSGECSEILELYLQTSKAKVVHDPQLPKSFYIRDRDCIETIRGTDEELLRRASSDDSLWKPQCFGYNQSAPDLALILLKILSRSEPPDDKVMQNLRKDFALGGVSTSGLDAYSRCIQSNQLSLFNNEVQQMKRDDLSSTDFSKLCSPL